MKFHVDGSQPKDNQIFVFGSNLAGVHGAGAAKAAMQHYGAKYGVGIGMTGRSYALPTKDLNIETLPLKSIANQIQALKQVILVHRDKEFFITRVGCVLAGYSDEDIAPMFKGFPSNCDFPETWKKYIL